MNPAPPSQGGHLRMYRKRTTLLLRRYFRMSLETGRLPSLLGREFFRTRIISYRVQSFEDAVIFVHDIERCLDRLDHRSRQIIARVILQEYTEDEAAPLLGFARQKVVERLGEALDKLSRIFLAAGILHPLPRGSRK